MRILYLILLFLAASPVLAQEEDCGCWIDPDSSWTYLGNSGSQAVRPSIWQPYPYGNIGHYFHLELPFAFGFFGNTVHSLYINQIGTVSFGSPMADQQPVNLPVPTTAFIAPYWAMTTVYNPGYPPGQAMERLNEVAYKLTPTALFVSWKNMGNAANEQDTVNSFQLIISNGADPLLPNGNNIAFCYDRMRWGLGRNFVAPAAQPRPSIVGINQGDGVNFVQVGRFDQLDSLWNGRFVGSGCGWLTGRRMELNASNAQVPPFFSTTECDTVEVDAGSTGYYRIIAHRGSPAPPVVVSAACPTLPSFAIANQQVDGAHVLTASFTPTTDEVGLHTLYFQAATNLGPLSTTQRFVKVRLPLGVAAPSGQLPINIFPNPASGLVQLSWNRSWAGAVLQVANAEGRILVTTPVAGHTFQWDAGGLPDGVYMVRLVSRGGTAVARMAIAR